MRRVSVIAVGCLPLLEPRHERWQAQDRCPERGQHRPMQPQAFMQKVHPDRRQRKLRFRRHISEIALRWRAPLRIHRTHGLGGFRHDLQFAPKSLEGHRILDGECGARQRPETLGAEQNAQFAEILRDNLGRSVQK